MSAGSQKKMVTAGDEEVSGGIDLNLSLNFSDFQSQEQPQMHEKLKPMEVSLATVPLPLNPNPALTVAPAASADRHVQVVVDVKKPATGVEHEDGGSQNSILTTQTRKRTQPEDELRQAPGREASPRAGSDDEDGENSRKKLRLSRDQSAVLEETFKAHSTLNPRQKQALAKQLGLSSRQVEVWFQNRRARTKLKQTEVDCEYLKRTCEDLMDQVRRLQKEAQELRALKTPQFFMQMVPPTTLTLCPSCDRVGASSSAPAAAPVNATHMGRARPGLVNPWAASGQMNHRAAF